VLVALQPQDRIGLSQHHRLVERGPAFSQGDVKMVLDVGPLTSNACGL
jgi:hypothetical protein